MLIKGGVDKRKTIPRSGFADMERHSPGRPLRKRVFVNKE